MKKRTFSMTLFLFLLTACSSRNSPLLIAGAPANELIAAYPLTNLPIQSPVYQGRLELEVRDIQRAVDSILEIAEDNGGFMISIHQWTEDNYPVAQIVISIPAAHFEAAWSQLTRVGRSMGYHVSPDPNPVPGSFSASSEITITLYQKSWLSLFAGLRNTHLADTLRHAWEILSSLLIFLFDVIVWLLVVVGPFGLLGWGIIKIIRRRKQPDLPNSKNAERIDSD